MPNYIVAQHVDDLMKSSNITEARDILGLTTSFETLSNDINNKNTTQINNLSSNLYLEIQTNNNELSSFVNEKVTRLTSEVISTTFSILSNKSGVMFLYTGNDNISAFITPSVNIVGFTSSFAQLSTGSITIALSSYPNGRIISYGQLYKTAGEGATANITRVDNNNFLLTGLLE